MRVNDKKLEKLLITLEFKNEKERIYYMIKKKLVRFRISYKVIRL